ncbi:hypothetical protein ACWFQE_25395, partial [Streptomyces bacillaris]
MAATTQFTDRPDPARADAAIAKVSTWDVGTPERQRQGGGRPRARGRGGGGGPPPPPHPPRARAR